MCSCSYFLLDDWYFKQKLISLHIYKKNHNSIDDIPYNLTESEITNNTVPNEDEEKYNDYIHRIDFKPSLWMDGKSVTCLTEHFGYEQSTPEENKADSFKITIPSASSSAGKPTVIDLEDSGGGGGPGGGARPIRLGA